MHHYSQDLKELLQLSLSQVPNWGIKHTEYLAWDPKHRFVLVERIVHTVKEISLQYRKAPSVMRILYQSEIFSKL